MTQATHHYSELAWGQQTASQSKYSSASETLYKKILSTKLVMLLHNTLIVTLTGSFTLIT